MSFDHINWIRDFFDHESLAVRHLVLCVATRTDDNGRAFPGYETLSKDTGMTVRSVRRLLEQIPVNVVEIIPGGSVKGKPRRPTTYRILIPDHAHKGQDHAPDAHGAASKYKQDRAPDAHSSALDRAPDAHGTSNGDRAHTRTPTVRVQTTTVRVHDTDRAPDAHLTVLTESNTKEVTDREKTQSRPSTPKKEKGKSNALRLDVRPTFEELAAFCASEDMEGEAAVIDDYWNAKGFITGKTPIKDWQAFVRNWKRRRDKFAANGNNNRNSPVRGPSDETRELLARKPARTL
jgi:hypothetical protein